MESNGDSGGFTFKKIGSKGKWGVQLKLEDKTGSREGFVRS